MADTRLYVQGQDYTLAGSGVTSSANSVTLASFTTPQGALLTMSDFGTKGYGVFEPETEMEENISFTGVTQNANGTATLTGVTRGLNFVSPYTTSASLQQAHAGGTTFRISNTAPFYNDFANKENNESINQVWTFATGATPVITDAPVGNTDAANKAYVDGVAVAGAPNMNLTTKGIAEEATTAEINADTQTGGTGAELAVNPFYLSTSKYLQQSGFPIYAASSAGTDTYAITLSPVPTAYANGMTVRFKTDVGNTGAATLNVNGLGAISITKNHDQTLETGDIEANQIVEVTYNSTGPRFQMQSQGAQAPLLENDLTAKGDIITASAASTPVTLAIGSQNQTFLADSDATTGNRWGFPQQFSVNSSWVLTETGSGTKTYSGLRVSFNTAASTNDRINLTTLLPNKNGTATDALRWADLTNGEILDITYQIRLLQTADTDFAFGLSSVADITTNLAATTPKAIFKATATTLEASSADGATEQDASAGAITLTNWNTYRIVLTMGTNAKFYVNGSLVATNTTIPTTADTSSINIGVGIKTTTTASKLLYGAGYMTIRTPRSA